MANTFLAAQGHDMAASLVETDRLEVARDILARARGRGLEVVLPTDLVVTDDLEAKTRIETVAAGEVPRGTKAVDIGPATREAFAAAIAAPAPCSGTAPWGCSRSRRSTPAPAPWP